MEVFLLNAREQQSIVSVIKLRSSVFVGKIKL